MSKIPTPYEVSHGLLPTVEQLQELAQKILNEINRQGILSPKGQFVLYGSLMRGDATQRSDMDLAFVPYDLKYFPHASDWEVMEEIKGIIQQNNWNIDMTIMLCSSRKLTKRYFGDPYSRDGDFSPTTFDHFSFLMRNPRFDEETRNYYANIQKEILKYTGTSFESRLRDLQEYIRIAKNEVLSFLRTKPPYNFDKNEYQSLKHFIEQISKIENYPYHVLRKIGGIAKNLGGSDAKSHLRECFNNPDNPFFAALLEQFDQVLQFAQDIDQIVTDCLGNPEKEAEYEKFLQTRLRPLAEAVMKFLELVEKQTYQTTFLEQITEKPITIILPERFVINLEKCYKEKISCRAIHWIYTKGRIQFADIISAFVEYESGERHRLWTSYSQYKPKSRYAWVTIDGRMEVDFSCDPPGFFDYEARAIHSCPPGLLEKVHGLALDKIQNLLAPYNPVPMENPTPKKNTKYR